MEGERIVGRLCTSGATGGAMKLPTKPRWCWCPTCHAWIGATPPLLPVHWPAETSAAMHKSGIGHATNLLTLSDILARNWRDTWTGPETSHVEYRRLPPPDPRLIGDVLTGNGADGVKP
jgi:hypothetical protein